MDSIEMQRIYNETQLDLFEVTLGQIQLNFKNAST